MPDPDELVNIDEMATMLGISERTLRRFYLDGTVPAYKLGYKILRFKPKEVREAIRQANYKRRHK